MKSHAVVSAGTKLALVKVVPEAERVADDKGFALVASLRPAGNIRIFSVIMKDVKVVIPVLEWGKLQTELTKDGQISCTPPAGAIEECEGGYLALDIELPFIEVNAGVDRQEIEVVISKITQRGPIKTYGDITDKHWGHRWRQHLGCEPPVETARAVVYEIHTQLP